jgi:hypothetical protein
MQAQTMARFAHLYAQRHARRCEPLRTPTLGSPAPGRTGAVKYWDGLSAKELRKRLLYWIGGAIVGIGLVIGRPLHLLVARSSLLQGSRQRRFSDTRRIVCLRLLQTDQQIRTRGLTSAARSKLKAQVFPKLLSAGDAVLQKRSEGTSMKRSEFRQLADLYEFAADAAPDEPRAISRFHYTQGTLALLDGRLSAMLLLRRLSLSRSRRRWRT